MADPFATANLRRERLPMIKNPRPGLDDLVTLDGGLEPSGFEAAVEVRLRYVPDRHVLSPATFGDYLAGLAEFEWASLEDVGQTMLGDLNSELVPRWSQLILTSRPEGRLHNVVLEDRQPRWDNPALLARLMPH